MYTHYSFVDSRPTIESYKQYPSQPFEKLVPYQTVIMVAPKDDNSLRLSIPIGRRICFRDYSPNGVCQSKTGDTWYIRFTDQESKEGLRWYAAKVSQACVDIWRAMGKYVIAKFNASGKFEGQDVKVVIQSGLPSLQESLEKTASEQTFFLSGYTKLRRFDGKNVEHITLPEILGKSGESFFHLEASLKTFDFEYNPIDKVIAVKCFQNVADLTWIDVPSIKVQDLTKEYPSKDYQKEKEEERLVSLTSFIYGKLKASAGGGGAEDHKDAEKELIPDSQPNPILSASSKGKANAGSKFGTKRKRQKEEEEEQEF